MNQQTAPKLHIRITEPEDSEHLKSWLFEPGVLRWFPMFDEREVEDAVRIWVSYAKHEACFTIECDGVPCGVANLYLQPYKKLAHQSLFAIIVSEKFRNKGIGTTLLTYLIKVAKEKFNLEILHLEVYEGNPAIHLYRRMGFVQYGVETHFIRDSGEYISKIMMQKIL
ncbi:MAG: GNAT family N-acetyltransferase [Chlamydiales bacterium]|nr:GNAT family N-acetyltransferase [Chlamydiales bacterium]